MNETEKWRSIRMYVRKLVKISKLDETQRLIKLNDIEVMKQY